MGDEIRVGGSSDELEGYLAEPPESSRAGVVILPARYGLEDGYKRLADALAEEGYAALALHWQTREQDPPTAQSLHDLQNAAAFLQQRGCLTLGLVGFCRGGTLVLWALATQAVWRAGVALYSLPRNPSKNDPPGTSLWDVSPLADAGALLLLHGAEDGPAPIEDLTAYARRLTTVGSPFQFTVFSHAGHRYFLPSDPGYAPEAARGSWREMTAFLHPHLHASDENPWEHPARDR